MMNNSLFAIAIDCADAAAQARFWASVLGRQVAEASTSEHAVLLARSGDTCEPCIVFNKVPEAKIVRTVSTSTSSATPSTTRVSGCLAWALAGSATSSQTTLAGRPSPTSKATSST